jgi:hypothetical protein
MPIHTIFFIPFKTEPTWKAWRLLVLQDKNNFAIQKMNARLAPHRNYFRLYCSVHIWSGIPQVV